MSRKVWLLLLGMAFFALLEVSSCRSGRLERTPLELSKTTRTVTPTPFQASSPTATPAVSSTEDAVTPEPEIEDIQQGGEEEMISIRVVYDNDSYQPGLTTAWGFSAFITYKDHNVLFDTGGDGRILLNNMKALGIDPASIQFVVLSHDHSDHTGGLLSLLGTGAEPAVYLLPYFSQSYKNQVKARTDVVEVHSLQQITERIYTTGQIQGSPPEQALVIDTTKGLVVITGCAHPGVANMVRAAKQALKEEIYLVIGGFHLGSASSQQVQGVIRELKGMGVLQVAPCHCTGDQAISQFREAYGNQFLQVGAGALIEIPQ
jgi:7,8-dihydropterin-6-yl-methyl-4-(beta-D-ribofuranosyl)aminobenzene 5'-phosphate synthase